MTTTDQMVNRIRRRATQKNRPLVGQINGAVTTGDTVITVNDGTIYKEGDVVEVDYELMLIESIATNDLTVFRSWDETTATDHVDNSFLWIEHPYPKAEALAMILEEITSWPDDIGVVSEVEWSFAANVAHVDSGATRQLKGILQMNDQPYDTYDRHGQVEAVPFPDDGFASGWGVRLRQPFPTATTVTAIILEDFDTTTFDFTQDLQTDLLIPTELEPAIFYGVLSRMINPDEAAHLDAGAGAVVGQIERNPVGYQLQGGTSYKALRDEVLTDYSMRLMRRYGLRRVSGV